MRFSNVDSSIHVAELCIGETVFHLHEMTTKICFFSPDTHTGTTICIGLFVSDVAQVINKAVEAGAIEVSPAQDYAYGYRQGMIGDPFKHYWQIQKK